MNYDWTKAHVHISNLLKRLEVVGHQVTYFSMKTTYKRFRGLTLRHVYCPSVFLTKQPLQ